MFAGGCCHRETNDYYIRVEGTTPELKTTIPIDGGTVPLLSPEQKLYVDMTRARRIKYFADKVSRGAMQDAGYYPMSVTLKCVCPSENEHTFTVSESANFENAITFNTERPNVALYNLKIAQKYYWKNCRGDVFEFTTEDKAPRLLKIDGVPNVRDLGGRIGLNGKRVKQGLIYRTAGLNDNAR